MAGAADGGWILSPIESLMNQRHPLGFLVMIPVIILVVRIVLRWLAFLNRLFFRRTSDISPGLFVPRRVQGSVHEYGVVELKGHRPYMEDRHTVVPNLKNNSNVTLYGVFDGHGGDAAAQYCSDFFGAIISDSPIDISSKPEPALSHAFKTIDQKFLELANMRNRDDGTTALVAIANGKNITIANVGDSRAILVQSNGRVIPLSRDHKPDRNDERDRITRLGGSVIHWGVWRVEGVLAVSRAIGDRMLKEYVIPDPEFVSWVCSPDDMFLVLATDGLWDVLDNNQVGKILFGCKDAQEGAEILTQEAFKMGTMDNVTVLVVDIRNVASKSFGESSISRSDQASSPPLTSSSSTDSTSKFRKKNAGDKID